MTVKWKIGVGVACLAGGSIGQVVQYVVTPLKKEQADAAERIATASQHLGAMRWATGLDVLILLILPALLYVGWVAGARTSRLASIGTALAFGTSLCAGYLLAVDVIVYEAARQPDHAAGAALLKAFEGSGVVTGLTVAWIIGHTVGLVLLGIALFRSRAVPRPAAVALGLAPFVEMAGVGSGAVVVGVLGELLLCVGFLACAQVLLRTAGDTPEMLPTVPAAQPVHAF